MKNFPISEIEPNARNGQMVSPCRFVTESEAARYLGGVSRSFLAKKRCTGGGPRFTKLGRRVLYEIADLDEFAEQGKRRSTSDSTAA